MYFLAALCLLGGVVLWPDLLARLATADGRIDSEPQRLALMLLSVTLLCGGAAMVVAARRAWRILACGALGALVGALGCAALFGWQIWRFAQLDPLDRLTPGGPLARTVELARESGGEPAARQALASWYATRAAEPPLPPYHDWDAAASERAARGGCVLDGNLGCLLDAQPLVPWQPGEPLQFSAPPLPIELLFPLQRQLFLFDLLRVPPESGQARALAFAAGFMQAWRDDNLPWPQLRMFAWGDDPTSNRIQAQMSVMAARRAQGVLGAAEEQAFLRSLLQHADRLMDPAQHNFGTNHGMMQNAALIEIALRYPEFDGGTMWRRTALERMQRAVEEHVASDGAFLELTPGYHLYATGLLLWFQAQASAANLELQAPYAARLRGMARFICSILQPDRSFPLIADTHASKVDLSRWPWSRLPDWPELAALRRCAGERAGLPNLPGAELFGDSGYFVLRAGAPDWSEANAIMATLMLGPGSHAHQHADKLSLTWYGAGRALLSGPGYPDYYDAERRLRLIATPAQNAVSVDGGSQAAGGVETSWVVLPEAGKDGAGPVAIQGLSRLFAGVEQRRTLLAGAEPGELLLVDELVSAMPHSYRQHFRPGAGLSASSAPGEQRLVQPGGEAVASIATRAWIDGSEAEPDQEMTDGVGAFRVHGRNALLVTRLRILRAGEPPARLELRPDGLSWQGRGGSLELVLPPRNAQDLRWQPAGG